MGGDQLLRVAPEQQEKVASWLVAFDETWHDGALSDWAAKKLPKSGDPLRLVALTELAKVDLERQWRAGHRVLLESYFEQFPELSESDDALPELIAAEFQVRREAGDKVKVEEFARRFPDQSKALSALAERGEGIEQDSATLLLPLTSAARETPRPSGTSGTVTAESKAGDSLHPLPPELDRYRILKKLGQGGMGAVYLAHDIQLERKVALKIPHFSESDGSEIADRFLREARAAATIHHPNLCPVYDVGEVAGVHYMTMAFIEGRALSDYLSPGKPIAPRKAAGLVRLLALAIHEAHTRDIIHRDLKPSNIMMNDRNQPVIMDFGLARRSGKDDPPLTQSGALLGTPAYMSPEQAKGRLDEIGPCSDIYSLGVIFYELLTGQRPFRGVLMEVLSQILTADPEPPCQLRPGLDPNLEAICLKAMAKTPAERYATAADLAEALTEHLRATGKGSLSSHAGSSADELSAVSVEGAPKSISSRVPSRKAASNRFSTRKKLSVAAGGLAALLICFAIVLLVRTPKGTVRIELSDPDAEVEVSIDGDTVDLKGIEKPLRFEVGEHELIVRGDDYELHMESFTVKRGDNRPIRVELVPLREKSSVASDEAGNSKQTLEVETAEKAPELDPTQKSATSESPFTNSLGMKFVPVPITSGPTSGQRVLFSVWETRVQDYRAFAEATNREWPKPEFEQGDDHPAVNVSWVDAVAFCQWLTERERAARTIGPDQTYRLPSDYEWSCAAGLGETEDPAALPKDRQPKGYGAKGQYPWGDKEYPQFGNYSGKEHYEGGGAAVPGYKDGYATTAPVGSYKANEFGLLDLGGNVWELCDGYYDDDRKSPKRIRRGAGWNTFPLPEMKSSWRKTLPSDGFDWVTGFRCVLSDLPTS